MAAKKSLRKKFFTALKILISIGLLYWVFSQMNWNLLKKELRQAEWIWLFIAWISFVLSQVISVWRMQLYLKKVDVHLPFLTNAQLYALGMFYNFFIPGGVGGDAYKVIALRNHFQRPLKELTSAIFFDRFIGLCAIAILICFSIILLPVEISPSLYYSILLLGSGGLLVGPMILGKIYPKFKKIFFPTLIYSFAVQAFQIGSVLSILISLEQTEELYLYIVIFLISSVLSIISFAGLGIRESIFYYAGEYFKFNPDVSAGVALMFSVISLLTSLIGGIYVIKKIDFGLKPNHHQKNETSL
ncbi:Uncharacterised protein family (UPF0104) [Candidatus Ornithobacterium hominis]|uniref:lysylphosphatidylglycerol synthase transmembrane domain-containing protein n=1 Tax=Candidatus Ornithobacterium hominis TaxID=2497989 RepID=UPI000E5C2272|nr:lysylphosphatidylglycerol synthase transmembrane domain-containing protein [Candidatus Ornithobacterium hominis]SZD71959.1 Uncharacterised protein family (UPF0104) [Candidatus Ornithobacterium hominis]